MKRLKFIMFGLVMMLGFSVASAKTVVRTNALPGLTIKENFVPEKADFHDYFGGVSDIAPENGDGVTTFAHATSHVPVKGDAIKIKTSMMIYSKNSVENGGDGIDSWLTYSFSPSPAGTSDSSIPYYAGIGTGYFLHIDNYSGNSAPNCVSVKLVKSVAGSFTDATPNFFLDNAVTNPYNGAQANAEIVFWLEFFKVGTNYTLRFTNAVTNAVLKEVTDITIDDSILMNASGQTFVSTTIYEGPGCDGKHWEHRAVKFYTYNAYTYDTTGAVVTLEADTFDHTGSAITPAVTSVVVGGETLVVGTDYVVSYADNVNVGTGKAVITFKRLYAGTFVEKEFAIVSVNHLPIATAADLVFGTTVTIGTEKTVGKAMSSNVVSANYISEYNGVYNEDGSALRETADTMLLTLEMGAAADTFAFKVANGNKAGEYLTLLSDENRLQTSVTKDIAASWTITFDGGGNAVITNYALANQSSPVTRTIQYNVGDPRFATYTTAQTPVKLFVDLATKTDANAAASFANEVVSGVGLGAFGKCEDVKALLDNGYSRLSVGAKSIFDSSAEEVFVNARLRMQYLEAWVLANSSSPTRSVDKEAYHLPATALIGIVGLSAMFIGCFLFKKKKEA
ncbi:MAG: hypothetical protein ACOX3C_02425 [Bacilli bacterium]|jgi:hypothetical protein